MCLPPSTPTSFVSKLDLSHDLRRLLWLMRTGKCGACEAVGSDGKKYRICVAKVPKTDKPLVLK